MRDYKSVLYFCGNAQNKGIEWAGDAIKNHIAHNPEKDTSYVSIDLEDALNWAFVWDTSKHPKNIPNEKRHDYWKSIAENIKKNEGI
jgi:hypothetical protein